MSPPTAEDVAAAVHEGRRPSSLAGDEGGGAPATRSTPTVGDPVSAGGLTVQISGGALLDSAQRVLSSAREAGLAAALVGRDATLWGPEAAAQAGVRLGWLDAVDRGRPLAADVRALREELAADGVDRVVLCGTGELTAGPEAVCASAGVPLVVVDSTDPGQVRAALTELERTVVVLTSSTGAGVAADSCWRAARAALQAAGVDPARRVVVVAGAGSPLEQLAGEQGCRAVFPADPDVGGRWSALTAVGLVPAGLAGVDVDALLDDAAALLPTLSSDDSPALLLGAVLGGGAVSGRDKLVLPPAQGLDGFGPWVESLVAGSTGKHGKGLLPVLVEALDAPGTEPAADSALVVVGASPVQPPPVGAAVSGPLGAQLLAWELATAVAAWALRIDPFDEPDLQTGEDEALPTGGASPVREPLVVEDGVEVHATGDLLAEVSTLSGALDALLAAVPDRGYLAVTASLDRHADAGAAQLRRLLASRIAHPVTFGWAPRSLHATGRLHRGGPPTGAFLQITGAVDQDLEVPGRDLSFGRLQAAQAAADLRALSAQERPVLTLHLTDRVRGLQAVLAAAEGRR